MNYEGIYKSIIENRIKTPLSKEVYGEIHHIIPRCLGGLDEKENLVKLSAREHFICHALLAEIYPKETFEWYKMNHAFLMMKCESADHGGNRYFNSRLYELKRKDFSKVMSFLQAGDKNSQKGTIWIYSRIIRRSIKIHKDELDGYLELGFERGRVLDFDLINRPKKIKSQKVKIKKVKIPKESKKKLSLIFENSQFNTYKINKLNQIFKTTISEGSDILKIKELLIRLYHSENLSLLDIAKMFNTNHVTLLNYFKLFNISRRSLSDSLKNYCKQNA